jgi:hypothetical protein
MLSIQNKKKKSFTALSKSNNRKTITKNQIIKKSNRNDHSDNINNIDDLFTIFKKQMIKLIQNGGKTL